MLVPQVSDHEIQAFRRFVGLLPRDKDPVLLILKGHLLIEEQLRLLVDERVAKPEALTQAQLECFQVICLAEAFCAAQTHPVLWDTLRKLNKLRNDIAHKIEPSGIHDRMANIVSLIEPHSLFGNGGISAVESDPIQQFDIALWLLFARVARLVKHSDEATRALLPNEQTTL